MEEIDLIKYDSAVEFALDSYDWWKRKEGNLDMPIQKLKEAGLYQKFCDEYLVYDDRVEIYAASGLYKPGSS